MAEAGPASKPYLFPSANYQDAPAAIKWLVNAFGFKERMVIRGPNGAIAHAELQLGFGIFMLGSVKDDQYRIRSPRELGGSTQAIYVCVPDTDAHFARAKAAGAEILMELTDTDYGSRDYTARDPEGHIWHFGTYDPYTYVEGEH